MVTKARQCRRVTLDASRASIIGNKMHWTHIECGPYRDRMFDLDRFIAGCRATLTSTMPSEAVAALAECAVAAPVEVEAVLGTPRQGGLFTLHHSPELTV